jgi:glucose/arabinose dehydrogenase
MIIIAYSKVKEETISEIILMGKMIIVLFSLLSLILISLGNENFLISAQPYQEENEVYELPIIHDSSLKAELVVQGLEYPTSIAFLGADDILVLEKYKGTVKRIVNGEVLPTLLKVNIAKTWERGMLGIAVSKNITGDTSVFLYFTEAREETIDDSKKGEDEEEEEKEPLGNRLYRYELRENKLINPRLLIDLPATPGPKHNGGVIMVGQDDNLYLIIGDVSLKNDTNPQKVKSLDGRSGVLKITQNGQAVGDYGIIGKDTPLSKYYAYGIRNSFGMDFDPVTGNLWDTENGPAFGDEINLVEAGFNSGWREVQGVWSPIYDDELGDYVAGEKVSTSDNDLDLLNFDGKGKYSSPEFAWEKTIGVTALTFLGSDRLGKEYQNDLFVGDINHGTIYHFDLTEDRKELVLEGQLADKIMNINDDPQDILFGTFNITEKAWLGISDIEVGPDGYLYVVSHGQGAIFRILPS